MDPKDDVVNFLQNNLDTSNIDVPFDRTTDVDHANHDGPQSYPSVAIVSKDPTVQGGGSSGATGIDPTGGGAIQDVVYLIQIDCWGGPADADVYQGNAHDPDTTANQLGQAVHSACRAGPNKPTADYEWMYADPPEEADDTEEPPVKHRDIVYARVKLTYTP